MSDKGSIHWNGAAMPFQLVKARKVETLQARNSHRWKSLPFPPSLLWMSVMTAMAGLLPTRAWAHVKWFAPYDVSQQPTPVSNVLTTHFILVLVGFTALLVAFCSTRFPRSGVAA